MLLFDKKLTAKEAEERNIVNEVIPHVNFEAETRRRLEAYAKFNDEVKSSFFTIFYIRNTNPTMFVCFFTDPEASLVILRVFPCA